MKICPKCKIKKPKSEFYKNKTKKDGLHPQCKVCANKYITRYHQIPGIRESRKIYAEKYRKTPAGGNTRRKATLKYKYGITLGDYIGMLKSQDNVCKICGSDTPGGKFNNFLIDHDHKTGKVRGLLCNRCNSILGHSCDSIEILDKVIQYLS